MNKGSLKLPFEVVGDSHDESHWLCQTVRLFFAEVVEGRHDQDWAKVFEIEDIFPLDLFADIFDVDLHVVFEIDDAERHVFIIQ